jgi:WD40 repeat protein
MRTLRSGLSVILVLFASLTGNAEESRPRQEPQLRLETEGHTARIRGMDITADGKLLITGSADKTARLWSLPTGQLVRVIRPPISGGIFGQVDAVAITPDGKTIALAGDDARCEFDAAPCQFVDLYNSADGTLLKRLGPYRAIVYELAFSPDGSRLAAAAGKQGLFVWDNPLGEQPRVATAVDAAYSAVFNATGTYLATGAADGAVTLYGTDLSQPLRRSPGRAGATFAKLAFSPDGTNLAVGYESLSKIDLYYIPELSRAYEVNTSFSDRDLTHVTFSADGEFLYAGGNYDVAGYRHPVIRWPQSGRGVPQQVMKGPNGAIAELIGLPQGGFAFASFDGSVGAYTATNEPWFYRDAGVPNMSLKFSNLFVIAPDGKGVRFGLKFGDVDPVNFDAASLQLKTQTTAPADYIQADTKSLDVGDWSNGIPTLNGKNLLSNDRERARSLAIAPDRKRFYLSTIWSLYGFSDTGAVLWNHAADSPVHGLNLSADGTLLIAAVADGTLRWYRAATGELLLSLFVYAPDRRWIAWTPSGYYAASPGGESLIGWHVNGATWTAPTDFFPAALFREKFYRPDIVKLILDMRDEAKAVSAANEAAQRKDDETRLPAVVEILTDPRGLEATGPELSLKYRLRSPSGRPVTRLELRVDGQLVQPRAMQEVDETLELDRDLTLTVPLPPRDAAVSLTAFIQDQPSATVSVPVHWNGESQSGPKPKLYALLVGVSNYDEPQLKLSYAAKDAMDMDAVLKRQKGRFFDDVQTVLLLDDKADEDEIEIQLARLRKTVGPDDYALVFMAGHGVTDAQGGFHFLPANASLAEDELAARSLDGVIIRNMLRTMQGKVLFFMDACNAGNGIGNDQSLADMTGFANEFALSNGVVMYASSTGRQFSYENAQWSNGAFTKALIATLDDEKAFGADGRLSIFELAEELSTRVSELTNGLQTPVMTKSAAIPVFYLASAP